MREKNEVEKNVRGLGDFSRKVAQSILACENRVIRTFPFRIGIALMKDTRLEKTAKKLGESLEKFTKIR